MLVAIVVVVMVLVPAVHHRRSCHATRIVPPVPGRHVQNVVRHDRDVDQTVGTAIVTRAIPIAVLIDVPVAPVPEHVVVLVVVPHQEHVRAGHARHMRRVAERDHWAAPVRAAIAAVVPVRVVPVPGRVVAVVPVPVPVVPVAVVHAAPVHALLVTGLE